MNNEFFIMVNKHVESCGNPPIFINKNTNNYYSYFENDFGEQWVFEYDYSVKTGKLYGGDAGWEQVFMVIDSQVENLILNTNEKTWLQACWLSATSNMR